MSSNFKRYLYTILKTIPTIEVDIYENDGYKYVISADSKVVSEYGQRAIKILRNCNKIDKISDWIYDNNNYLNKKLYILFKK